MMGLIACSNWFYASPFRPLISIWYDMARAFASMKRYGYKAASRRSKSF
jgi:hypothetical protein